MDIKYQVFVSSTYSDLIDERQEVMQALLELDCIPVGMELFPAADDDQWTLIKGLIRGCDYYVLIIGGRYGSIGPEGKSYTQMEYEYAVSEGIPVISFINEAPEKIPSGKTETTDAGREKLKAFLAQVKTKMCRQWSNPADLGSQVSRSLIKLIKAKPRTGWIKADQPSSEEINREITLLRRENDQLKARLEKLSVSPPVGTESLQQGDDTFEIRFNYYWGSPKSSVLVMSWNQIIFLLSPLMMLEASEADLKGTLNNVLKDHISHQQGHSRPNQLNVNDIDFQTIKIQLMALGLIIRSEKKRSVKESGTYWTLTPYGETIMMQLRAIKKGQTESPI